MRSLTTSLKLYRIETHQKLVIISECYRSMYNTNEQNKLLSEEIAKIGKKNKNNHIRIGGDFNLPDIDWSNNSISAYSDQENTKSGLFLSSTTLQICWTVLRRTVLILIKFNLAFTSDSLA